MKMERTTNRAVAKRSSQPRRRAGRAEPAPKINQAAMKLLQEWIDTYGDRRDRDLDRQLESLARSRLVLGPRC
jgi:hypothetical protein